MTMKGAPRYARRIDSSQASIVDALRAAGCTVFIISKPVDLLVTYEGRWQPMECKPEGAKPRSDQAIQTALCELLHIPVVKTPQEALEVMGLDYGGN